MNKRTKKILLLCASTCLAGVARAEFGVSAGASFNYKAKFQTRSEQQGRLTNPGSLNAATDHFYDDGYNRVDSSGNAGDLTSYWGYQNASQDNAGSLTINSAQTIIDQQSSSTQQSDPLPAIEIYWQSDLTENERWNLGLRAALRWQRIDFDSSAIYNTTVETLSDTYTYTGILPGAPFNGSLTGPNFLMGDTPNRTYSYANGDNITVFRKIKADIFALDLGPTLSVDLTDKTRLTTSIGGTIAWINSEFSYRDGSFAKGEDTEQEWLFGAYAGADLQYLIGEHWGIFGGAVYTRLENYNQQVDGCSSELQFEDSYTIRAGLFIR